MKHSIAIDGPAGAGKSTAAKALAAALGVQYLDSGALYRAMALYADRHGVAFGDEPGVTRLMAQADIAVRYENGSQRVILDGADETGKLRTERIGLGASTVSKYPAVRDAITALCRRTAADYCVVMDGRDICTNVLRDTPHKFFLTADSHVRALRRLAQLQGQGQTGDLAVIEADIIARDKQDSERAYMPLKCEADTVRIDTSALSIDEVVTQMLQKIREVEP